MLVYVSPLLPAVLQVCRIKRRAATDVDALRVVEVVATFQLDSLIAVRGHSMPTCASHLAASYALL